MSILSLPDTHLFFEEIGQGEPWLVMHGGLGLNSTYMRGHDMLADRMRLYYYDHRGNGRSDRAAAAGITFENLTADADRMREHAGAASISIIANSYGAAIALQYAHRYPQRVKRLILTGASASFDAAGMAPRAYAKGATEEQAEFFVKPATDDADLAHMFWKLWPVYFGDFYDEVQHRQVAKATSYSLAALARSFEILAQHDLRSSLASMTMPTLIIAGGKDYIVPLADAELLCAGLPNATIAVFEHSGHFPFLEEPERYRQTIDDWLALQPI